MSGKRPLEDFYLNTPDEDVVYEQGDATTVDDSYLAHLSERLARKGEGGGKAVGPGPATAPRPAAPPHPSPSMDLIADVAIVPGGVVPVAHRPAPSPFDEGQLASADIMEVGDSDLVAIEDSARQLVADAVAAGPLEGPLQPGPSDLLQIVPPPPVEDPLVDPELNPATYDAPTFIRPSLVEQEPLPVVEIVQGNERGRAYRVEKDAMSIGRGLDNDVVLTDIAVSRRHVRLLRHGMQVTAQDLGSGNGTLVNGSRASSVVLGPNDRVEIGNTIFRIVFPGQGSFPPPAPAAFEAPPPAASPLHNRATAYLEDGQQVLQQIGMAPAGHQYQTQPPPAAGPQPATAVLGAVAPTPIPPGPIPTRSGETDGVQVARPRGVPRSFKVAMAALAATIVVIGIVGLVAAILHARSRVAQPPPSPSDQPTADGLFARGREAYVNKRWGQAADAFERVLALAPDNQQAAEYLAQARAEERNQGTLEAASQAVAEENFEDAVATLRTIPQSSVYSTKALEVRREAETRQAAALVGEARRLQAEGDAEAARARLEQALELDPSNADARALQGQLAVAAGGTPPPTVAPPAGEPPRETEAVAVAAGGGGRPGRPPRAPPRETAPPERPVRAPTKGSSAGLAQIVTLYKRGQFGPAADRARELAASGSEAERAEARTLATRIDRFAKAWSGVQSGGSARQKMSYLETALRLDEQISGGHFGGSIRPKLRDTYVGNAQRAWRAGQYATACQSALRALKIDRTATEAAEISSRCDSKAQEYYEAGVAEQRSDLTAAKSYWRKVLNMVPRSSPWYSKAYTSLNNAGRGRTEDEDE